MIAPWTNLIYYASITVKTIYALDIKSTKTSTEVGCYNCSASALIQKCFSFLSESI